MEEFAEVSAAVACRVRVKTVPDSVDEILGDTLHLGGF